MISPRLLKIRLTVTTKSNLKRIHMRSTWMQNRLKRTQHSSRRPIRSSSAAPMKLGAIFDWDGVILDSSSHHEESWKRLAKEAGFTLPDGHFKKGFGMKNEFIIPNLLDWSNRPEEIRQLSLRKEALYREILLEWGIHPLPGVTEWLAELRQHGVPCAIGSSTHRLNIDTSLGVLGFEDRFAAIVTAEDVSRGKPDPEVFLTAA